MKKFSSITRVNSHRISRNKRLVQLVILALLLAVLLLVVPRVVTSVAAAIIAPVTITKTWFAESSTSFPQFIRDRQTLIDKINALESTLSGAGGNRVTIGALQRENNELRQLLGATEETRIVAGVIGRPDQLPYDVLMIDRGWRDGITVDAPVYVGDDTVIGIVRTVTANTALVELVTTQGFETTVYIFGPNIYTTAVGIGGGQLRVGVPQGIPLNIDDVVVIPAVASGVFGAINHVESSPSQPEQYGFVSTEVPLRSIRLVSVGATPLTPISFEEAEAQLATQREKLFVIPVPDDILIEIGTSTPATSTDDLTVPTTSPAVTPDA